MAGSITEYARLLYTFSPDIFDDPMLVDDMQEIAAGRIRKDMAERYPGFEDYRVLIDFDRDNWPGPKPGQRQMLVRAVSDDTL